MRDNKEEIRRQREKKIIKRLFISKFHEIWNNIMMIKK